MTDYPNHLDSVKFINNTFFANNSYLWSIRGYDTKSIFEHNTLVYGTVNPFLTRQGMHLQIRNNLFYAMHAMGGTPEYMWSGWFLNYPDTTSSGIIQIRAQMTFNGVATAGPEVFVDSARGVFPDMLERADESIDVQNNVYHWPAALSSFYQAYNDTVATYDSVDYVIAGTRGYEKRRLFPSTFINELGMATLDTIAAAGGTAVFQNNMDADPGFDATVTPHLAKLIEYVNKIATATLDSTWHYKPSGVLYPPTWPLPENLAYSNTALMTYGTDGFPVGDLNWFPAQKAAWLLTDVKRVEPVPQEFTLSQNYPNPFNPSTSIEFSLKKAEYVKLVVYNMLGQKVRTLADAELAPGTYVATWNGLDDHGYQLASGAYYYRMESKSFTTTRAMMLLK